MYGYAKCVHTVSLIHTTNWVPNLELRGPPRLRVLMRRVCVAKTADRMGLASIGATIGAGAIESRWIVVCLAKPELTFEPRTVWFVAPYRPIKLSHKLVMIARAGRAELRRWPRREPEDEGSVTWRDELVRLAGNSECFAS